MADRRRRCGCRLSLPGTDGREEAANQESAAHLKGQPTVKPEAWALRSVLGQVSDAGDAGTDGVVGVPTCGRR
jgi:hypothetical protein